MSATHERLHAKVTGRVQGVSFRYYTTQQALALGLSGWVMNLPDGRTVEVIAEGPRKDLQALLDWLRHGPSGDHSHQLISSMQSHVGRMKSVRYVPSRTSTSCPQPAHVMFQTGVSRDGQGRNFQD